MDAWPWAAVAAFDLLLVRADRCALSTSARRLYRAQPIVFGVCVAFVLVHWCRPDSHAHLDPLTRVGNLLRRH